MLPARRKADGKTENAKKPCQQQARPIFYSVWFFAE